MSQPEIPPMFPFSRYESTSAGFCWKTDGAHSVTLCEDIPLHRNILACVAAEYWLREIKQRVNGPKKADLVAKGMGLPEREAVQDQYDYECELKADEWRACGKL